MCGISPNVCLVSVLLYLALLCLIFALIAYRRAHPPKENPLFRIEQVEFTNGNTIYYCCRRLPFNQWRSFEIEEGVKGYATQPEAEKAMKSYLKSMGLEGNETTVVKEYG